MHRRHFLSLASLTALAACMREPDQTTRIIVVRHGDRDGNEAPNLNATGIARMANLDAAIADLPLDAIYIPDLPRNRQSAAALAAARGIEPTIVATSLGIADRLVREGEGRSIIWIGNKSNIADIWADLDLPRRPPLEYGEISVIEQSFLGRFTVSERFVPP